VAHPCHFGIDVGHRWNHAGVERLDSPTIAERIFKVSSGDIKDIMKKLRELGMRNFDRALFEWYDEGYIGFEEAIRNADSANKLRLAIKLKSKRG